MSAVHFVNNFYLYHQINPFDNSIEEIADILGLILLYVPFNSKFIGSKSNEFKGIICIKKSNPYYEKVDFFHELAHYLLEHTTEPTYRNAVYNEMKADHLAFYLALPQIPLISSQCEFYEFSEKYKLPYDFILQRMTLEKKLA